MTAPVHFFGEKGKTTYDEYNTILEPVVHWSGFRGHHLSSFRGLFKYREVASMRGYKKILAMMLVVTVVAYSWMPRNAEASPGAVVSFAAKQAAKAMVKTSISRSVGNLALKEATAEVAEGFVKKEGMKLIVLQGGKKEMVDVSLDAAQKNVLKKEIDNVIDLKVYGNAPSWVKFVDWFVGIGTVVLIGELLWAAVTGDAQEFLDDIFYTAMRNVGFMTPAIPNAPNNVPGSNPQPAPADDTGVGVTWDFKSTYQYKINHNNYRTLQGNESTGSTSSLTMRTDAYGATSGAVSLIEVAPNQPVSTLFNSLTLNGYRVFTNGMGFSVPSQFGDQYVTKTISLYQDGKLVGVKNSSITYSSNFRLGSWFPGFSHLDTFQTNTNSPYALSNYNRIMVKGAKVVGSQVEVIYSFQSTYLNVPDYILKFAVPLSQYSFNTNYSSTATWNYLFAVPMNMAGGATARIGFYSDVDYIPKIPLEVPSISDYPDTVSELQTANNKVAIPTKSLFPPGYTFYPDTGTIKDPSGNPVNDPATIPEFNPDPVIKPAPDGGTVVDDVPVPEGKPDTADDPAKPDDPVDPGKPEDINWKKLKAIPAIFTTKFPFSLPWDAKNAAMAVFGDIPVTSKFVYVVEIPIGDGKPFKLDLSFPPIMDTFGKIFRGGIVIAFDLGLLYAVRKWFGGAS